MSAQRKRLEEMDKESRSLNEREEAFLLEYKENREAVLAWADELAQVHILADKRFDQAERTRYAMSSEARPYLPSPRTRTGAYWATEW